MSTISEKLALLLHTKSDLKASLIEKGQSVTDESVFADYADKVRAIETGAALPPLEDPGTADDLAAGKQLIGQDGNVVTGSVTTYGDGEGVFMDETELSFAGDTAILKRIFKKNVLFRSGSDIRLMHPLGDFGDATAADVAAGKTFTSGAGAKVTGAAKIANNEKVTFAVINNSSGTIWVESISPDDGSVVEQRVLSGGSCEVNALTGIFTVIGSHYDISLSVTEAFSVAAAVGFIPTVSTASVTVTDV